MGPPKGVIEGFAIVATVFAIVLAAWIGRVVAARYRRRVLALMAGGVAPSHEPVALTGNPRASVLAPASPAASASFAQNRRARMQLATTFVGISLAIGMSQAWFVLVFDPGFGPYSLSKWLLFGARYAWPMVPALGLLWRWGWWRIFWWTAAYVVAVGALIMLGSTENQHLSTVTLGLALEAAPPLLILAAIFSGSARATGPYLMLPLIFAFSASAVLGSWVFYHLLYATPETAQRVFGWVPDAMPMPAVLVLYALAAFLLMAWLTWRAVRAFANGYAAKRYSAPVYLFGGLWLIALTLGALTESHGIGNDALWIMALWLWIPIGFIALRRRLAPASPAPTLLVLRVFRRDAQTRALFDEAVESWRYSGPACLITGTDLALSTLDPEESFAFVSGRLRERFIGSASDLAQRLAGFDEKADLDGRFRITEFFCFDSTWKLALDALVARSDVVLMDLRGLHTGNLGCLHELQTLARASRVRRVVLLFDAETDRAAARSAVGGDDARFIWHDAGGPPRASARHTLRLLLEGNG